MISARQRLASTELDYYALNRLAEAGFGDPTRLPITVKILLEGLLRQADGGRVSETSLRALARWPERPPADAEVPYLPARVLLQDFTGVPAVLDLAAMRSAMQRAGKDAGRSRLAYHDGQWPRRARLGRGRDRGGGGIARTAHLLADAGGGRRPHDRVAAAGRDGDRPRPDTDRDAPRARRRQQIRRVLRRRSLEPLGARSRHALQHVPGVRRHRLPLPRRPADVALPGDDRARSPTDRPGRALHPRA